MHTGFPFREMLGRQVPKTISILGKTAYLGLICRKYLMIKFCSRDGEYCNHINLFIRAFSNANIQGKCLTRKIRDVPIFIDVIRR